MFTFKTEHSTGKYRSFYHDTHLIKLDKWEVGAIDSSPPYIIRLMVIKNNINEDGNPNCIWKWIKFKYRSESLAEAKKFLKDNFYIITEKYHIHKKEN